MHRLPVASRAALLVAFIAAATLRADHAPRAVLPDAVVDLRTTEGVARVKAHGRTLYLAAQAGIYRLRLNVAGSGALPKPTPMAKN